MPKSSTTIIAASCLLLGAGATVVWKQQSQSPAPEPSEDTAGLPTQTSFQRSRASRPIQPSITQTPQIKWSNLSDDSISRETRLNLARQIDLDLTPDAIDLLFEALHKKMTGPNETWWVVMNEIMEQMRKKGVAPERFGNELISLVEDSTQTEVARDYAVQHLSLWIAPESGNVPSETSQDVSTRALESIASTITDPSIAHTSIPGTAIMALTAAASNLSPETMAPVWLKLDPAMTSMLKGETRVPLSTRTTIIQSVALRGSSSHLPLIQSLARDEAVNPSMRLSSIAALGIYGSENDRAYLTSLVEGQTRYRYAAQSALKKFNLTKASL